jgi:hypothetical protein
MSIFYSLSPALQGGAVSRSFPTCTSLIYINDMSDDGGARMLIDTQGGDFNSATDTRKELSFLNDGDGDLKLWFLDSANEQKTSAYYNYVIPKNTFAILPAIKRYAEVMWVDGSRQNCIISVISERTA